MRTLELTNAKLINYKRGNNSHDGNPSWYASFANDTNSIMGNTASNSLCGYALGSFRDGRLANVTYHVTCSGNTIIDGITEAI